MTNNTNAHTFSALADAKTSRTVIGAFGSAAEATDLKGLKDKLKQIIKHVETAQHNAIILFIFSLPTRSLSPSYRRRKKPLSGDMPLNYLSIIFYLSILYVRSN
jgi:hypothetical protein